MGTLILISFIVTAALILIVMFAIALSTKGAALDQSYVQPRGYALRKGWLWALSAACVAALAISLPAFPYPGAAARAASHYEVIAMQYGFQIPSVVPLNREIVFDVTSRDVNHGFGIYGPSGRIVAQVQAMPDYVNHLPVRFTVPGHYTVRCLEYCGFAHAFMQGGFDVK